MVRMTWTIDSLFSEWRSLTSDAACEAFVRQTIVCREGKQLTEEEEQNLPLTRCWMNISCDGWLAFASDEVRKEYESREKNVQDKLFMSDVRVEETPFTFLFTISQEELLHPNEWKKTHSRRCMMIKEMLEAGADPNHVVCKFPHHRHWHEPCTALRKLFVRHVDVKRNIGNTYLHKLIDMFRLVMKYGKTLDLALHFKWMHPLTDVIQWFIDTPTDVKYREETYTGADTDYIGAIPWSTFVSWCKPFRYNLTDKNKNRLFGLPVWDSVEWWVMPREAHEHYTIQHQRQRLRDVLWLGGNANAYYDDVSLLMRAAKFGDVQTVKILLAYGATDFSDGIASSVDIALGVISWMKCECHSEIFYLLMNRFKSAAYIHTLTKQICFHPEVWSPEARKCVKQWLKEHPDDIKYINPVVAHIINSWRTDG